MLNVSPSKGFHVRSDNTGILSHTRTLVSSQQMDASPLSSPVHFEAHHILPGNLCAKFFMFFKSQWKQFASALNIVLNYESWQHCSCVRPFFSYFECFHNFRIQSHEYLVRSFNKIWCIVDQKSLKLKLTSLFCWWNIFQPLVLGQQFMFHGNGTRTTCPFEARTAPDEEKSNQQHSEQ